METFGKLVDSIFMGINPYFAGFIFILFLYATYCHLSGKNRKFTSITPNLLTGIGILGTFLGIFLGLLDFDVNDIDNSVPPLLAGMTTAFITSIFGMFFGVCMRGVVFLPQKKTEESAKSSEGFLSMVDEISRSVKKNDDNFQKVIQAIAGDGDSSVVNQISRLRTDSSDHHKELVREFKEFADKMAESNTEKLIEALEGVMRDFNTKINEQFGDNFKKLNEAVGALLQWQENYKEQLTIMEEQFKRCIDGIEKIENSIANIKENTDAIPQAMDKLPDLVNAARDSLEAFATMKEQAISAFPTIEENLGKLTDGLEKQVNSFETALKAQQESYKDLQESFSGLGSRVQETADAFKEEMQRSINNMMGEIQEEMKQTVNGLMAETKEGMKQTVTQVIEEMGGSLASLSNKFVEDYTPLTERLQELVHIAQNERKADGRAN